MIYNQLVQIAKELLIINDDLPARFDYTKQIRRASVNDFKVHIFNQTWGSTALGFGGWGGDMMTEANTYVFVPVTCNQKCFVYFGSKFAYAVDYTLKVREDIKKQQMEPVSKKSKYEE